MITLDVQHHKTYIQKYSSTEELSKAKESLKIFIKLFMPLPNGQKYKIESLFQHNSFPTPFLEEFKRRMKKKKIRLKINDNREYTPCYEGLSLIEELPPLWDTQAKAFEAIKKHNIGIITSATGSGKSRLILESVLHRNGKTLIIVPNTSIREQMVEMFSKYIGYRNVTDSPPKLEDDEFLSLEAKEKIEEEKKMEEEALSPQEARQNALASMMTNFNEKNSDDPKTKRLNNLQDLYTKDNYETDADTPEAKYRKIKKEEKKLKRKEQQKEKREYQKKQRKAKKKIKSVTIICYQSLDNISEEYLKQVDTLIVDECHHASAITYRRAFLKMPNAQYKYFFSATPWRDQQADFYLLLAGIGENVIYELRGKTAAEQGIISTPELIIVKPPKKKGIYKLRKPRDIIEEGILFNSERNNCIVQEAKELYDNGHNVFIAVNEIVHLEILEERFHDIGIDAVTIHGEMPPQVKNRNKKIVGTSKEPMISIGTMAVGEGTDMPNINAVVLASGGRSTIRLIQRIGRGSRKTSLNFKVIDFKDNANPNLYDQFKDRYKTFMQEFEELNELKISKLKKNH